MSQVQGTVFKVYENNKFKNPLYSIKIDGDDTYYGSGNVKPACAAGDVVTFDFVINNKGYHQLVPDSLKVVSKSATTSAPANLKSTGGGENWNARQKYWEDKDANDARMETEYRYRSASNQAVELVRVLGELGALPITKAQEASPSKKFDALMELTNAVAEIFYDRFKEHKGIDEQNTNLVADEDLEEFKGAA